MISAARTAEILRLYHAEKWPIGTIARQLGVHHGVVRRVLAHAGADAPRAPRPSIADPYSAFIVQTLTRFPTLRASRLSRWCASADIQDGPITFARSSRGTDRGRRPKPS